MLNKRLRVLIVANQDWFFLSHRLPLAHAIRTAGAEVVVVAGDSGKASAIRAEGFEFVGDPDAALKALRESGVRVDLFTFTQSLPNTSPKYGYPIEWHNVAALPVSTFDHWWKHQINDKTRNMVRRAEKKGVTVREVPLTTVSFGVRGQPVLPPPQEFPLAVARLVPRNQLFDPAS